MNRLVKRHIKWEMSFEWHLDFDCCTTSVADRTKQNVSLLRGIRKDVIECFRGPDQALGVQVGPRGYIGYPIPTAVFARVFEGFSLLRVANRDQSWVPMAAG